MAANSPAAGSIFERLQGAESAWRQRLQGWAISGDLSKAAQSALNLESEPTLLAALGERLARGETGDLPPIQLLDGKLLPDARGAYGWETATIYHNASWLATADESNIIAVLSEEFGHHLDALLNATDSPGDEGAQFAATLMGPTLSASALGALLQNDDRGVLVLDGAQIQVEFSEIIGTPGDDNLVGTEDADVLRGLGGNDWLQGLGGADQLFGDADNDTLDGGDGDDTLDGGAGDDSLYPGIGADISIGGDGFDYLWAYRQSDTTATHAFFFSTLPADPLAGGVNLAINSVEYNVIYGSNYNDILDFSAANDTQRAILYGYAGDDTLIGGAAGDNLDGGDGNDNLNGGTGSDSLNPGLGLDRVVGGDGSDYFYNDRRSDTSASKVVLFSTLPANPFADGVTLAIEGVEDSTIYASDYNDILDFSAADSTQRASLYGYAGDDTISSGAGNDTLSGGDGNDSINAGNGNDTLDGGDGDDTLDGGAGDDWMYGGAGDDILIDTEGNNYFNGGSGIDTFIAGDGNDFIEGGEGDEEINGGGGNDRIWGDYSYYTEVANSTDILRGGTGDDEINGGAGDDVLYGNAGNDYLYGGSDND
ncbi:MAG: calcium-binding protein, partial [Cyanobium sp.]